MAGNVITNDEFAQFKSIAVKKKVDSMELYLIGVNGHKYNMQEVGAMVFGNENYSYTVSLIHRCYSFSGQNGGKYRNGCRFEQSYGYRITRKDIEAFVKKYPKGTFNKGITFEDFLRTRVNGAKSAMTNNQRQHAQGIPKKHDQKVIWQEQFDFYDANDTDDNQMSEFVMRVTALVTGGIGILILLIMLLTGFWFKHMIIAMFVLMITMGAFKALKEL